MAHRGRLVRSAIFYFRDLKIWQHIVNDNYNYNYNLGGNIINNNFVSNNVSNNVHNSEQNFFIAPGVTPDAIATIEKGQ